MIKRLKHKMWMGVGRYEIGLSLFNLYEFLTGRKLGVVGRNTKFVVDGYPRSANTYLYSLIHLAYSDFKIAHHLHSPLQILLGVKYKIPTILVIRNPIDCVCSLKIREQKLGIKFLLENYIFFHTKIYLKRHSFYTWHFDYLLNDSERHISELEKYLSEFQLNERLSRNNDEIIAYVKYLDRLDSGNQGSENRVAIPTESRKKSTSEVKVEIMSSKYADLLEEANAVYSKFQ